MSLSKQIENKGYIFKKMLVPMCEDCFKKFSCIACIACYKESSELRPKKPMPPIQGDLPIRDYFKLFEGFILITGISKDNPGLKLYSSMAYLMKIRKKYGKYLLVMYVL